MARPNGLWLAYLRFDCGGDDRVVHLLCDTQYRLDEAMAAFKSLGPADGGVLIEYAVFHAARNISVREAPNFHVLTYQAFRAWWGGDDPAASAGPAPTGAPPRPRRAPLARLLGAPTALGGQVTT